NTLLEPLAMKKGLRHNVDIGVEVPNHLHGAATLVRRILTNLINNAIKFTATGHITVAMHAGDHNNYRITVADHGRGMTAAVRDRIFEEFYRGDITAESGVGMGLFIVDRLTRALDGTVSVSSEPGVGTQFVVCLPFALGSQPAVPANTWTRTYNLLLVEDV